MEFKKYQKQQMALQEIENVWDTVLYLYIIPAIVAIMGSLALFMSLYMKYLMAFMIGGNVSASVILAKYLHCFLFVAPVVAVGTYIYHRRVSKITENVKQQELVRGDRLVEENTYIEQIQNEESELKIGNIPLPKRLETLHTLVVGATGAGKTQTLLPMIAKAIENAEKDKDKRVVIYDFKGDFAEQFFDENKHFLFYPDSDYCVEWAPLEEVEEKSELATLASGFIPVQANEDFWKTAPRQVLVGILNTVREKNLRSVFFDTGTEDVEPKLKVDDSNMQIYTAAAELSIEELQEFVDEKYKVYLEAQETAAGIISELRNAANSIENITHLKGNWNTRRWLKEEQEKRVLFVYNDPAKQTEYMPIYNAFLSMLIQNLIRIKDINVKYQTSLFLDEISTLGNLSKLKDGLALGRSKGLRIFAGAQDISQFEDNYGRVTSRTILNNFRNIVTLSTPDPETAEYLSRRLGEIEIEEYQDAWGVQDERESLTFSRQKKMHRLVLPVEIQNLEPLHGFVRLATVKNVAKFSVQVFQK